jgi:hypothetical protein
MMIVVILVLVFLLMNGSMYLYQPGPILPKKKLLPWLIACYFILANAVAVDTLGVGTLFVSIPITVFICFRAYRDTRFCEFCGCVVPRRFVIETVCRKCAKKQSKEFNFPTT